MGSALLFAGAAFSAAAVWLLVRHVNRRERWTKRALATLVAVPALYLISFGPACRLADRGTLSIEVIRTFYRPVLFLAPPTSPLPRRAIHGYANWCGGGNTIQSIILDELVQEIGRILSDSPSDTIRINVNALSDAAYRGSADAEDDSP